MALAYYTELVFTPTFRALIKVLQTLGIKLRKVQNSKRPSPNSYVIISPDIHKHPDYSWLENQNPPDRAAVIARKILPISNRFLYYHPSASFSKNDLINFEKKGLTVASDLHSLYKVCSQHARSLEEWEIKVIQEPAAMAHIRFILHELSSRRRNSSHVVRAARECLKNLVSNNLIPHQGQIEKIAIDDINNTIKAFYEREAS